MADSEPQKKTNGKAIALVMIIAIAALFIYIQGQRYYRVNIPPGMTMRVPQLRGELANYTLAYTPSVTAQLGLDDADLPSIKHKKRIQLTDSFDTAATIESYGIFAITAQCTTPGIKLQTQTDTGRDGAPLVLSRLIPPVEENVKCGSTVPAKSLKYRFVLDQGQAMPPGGVWLEWWYEPPHKMQYVSK